jgi:hypothetical protein
VCVDLETGKVNAASELEAALGKSVAYVLAIDTRDAVKDVTRRYTASHYMTQTRFVRAEVGSFNLYHCTSSIRFHQISCGCQRG